MVRAFPTSRHLIAYSLAPVPICTNRCLDVQLPPTVTASYCDREIVIISVFQMCLLSGTEAERSESQSILPLLLMGKRALMILHLRKKLKKGEEQVACLQSSGSSPPPKKPSCFLTLPMVWLWEQIPSSFAKSRFDLSFYPLQPYEC